MLIEDSKVLTSMAGKKEKNTLFQWESDRQINLCRQVVGHTYKPVKTEKFLNLDIGGNIDSIHFNSQPSAQAMIVRVTEYNSWKPFRKYHLLLDVNS